MANKKVKTKKSSSSVKKKKKKFELKKIKKIPFENFANVPVYAICNDGATSTYTALTSTCSDSCGSSTFCC